MYMLAFFLPPPICLTCGEKRGKFFLNGKDCAEIIGKAYGPDVSARIMRRISAVDNYEDHQRTEYNSKLFLVCVEAETEVGVLDLFIQKVIEPSLAK